MEPSEKGRTSGPGAAFIHASRSYLRAEHLPRIRRCIEVLPAEDLWRRPSPASNSVGNLLAHLEATLDSVDGVLTELDPERLNEEIRIQGNDVTVLGALYHAVEHFSMHAGQIIYITKLRTGSDLHFYEVEDGDARRNW